VLDSTQAGRTASLRRLFSLRLVAVVVTIVAATAAIVRLPAALESFGDRAHLNAGQSRVGREIAGADAENIDNMFLVEALQLVPRNSSYAIVLPQSLAVAKTYGIVPATYHALPGFVQNVLLPRRQVDPGKAQYLLCYACDTDPYDRRMQRLWQDPHGLVIGKLTG
jgi:hypothetical protein